ncbi:MAG TPA: DedA family protein [Gaiellaceae bacterium]|nr:DedA family protein [Gaiellaceae bacterium]
MLLASISGAITQFVGDRGLYAVFVLMMIDAVFPAGSELVMVYAGALAAGAFAGQHVTIFGTEVQSQSAAFVAVVVAGASGYLVGAIIGWAVGKSLGRSFVEEHGRLLHLRRDNLERADAWFARYGAWAVFIGRLTPVVRSFVSIPAGVERMPFAPYTALTSLGSVIWCLVFAAIGWAVGDNYENVNHSFDYASALIVAILVVAVAVLGVRRRRKA